MLLLQCLKVLPPPLWNRVPICVSFVNIHDVAAAAQSNQCYKSLLKVILIHKNLVLEVFWFLKQPNLSVTGRKDTMINRAAITSEKIFLTKQ